MVSFERPLDKEGMSDESEVGEPAKPAENNAARRVWYTIRILAGVNKGDQNAWAYSCYNIFE